MACNCCCFSCFISSNWKCEGPRLSNIYNTLRYIDKTQYRVIKTHMCVCVQALQLPSRCRARLVNPAANIIDKYFWPPLFSFVHLHHPVKNSTHYHLSLYTSPLQYPYIRSACNFFEYCSVEQQKQTVLPSRLHFYFFLFHFMLFFPIFYYETALWPTHSWHSQIVRVRETQWKSGVCVLLLLLLRFLQAALLLWL